MLLDDRGLRRRGHREPGRIRRGCELELVVGRERRCGSRLLFGFRGLLGGLRLILRDVLLGLLNGMI